MSRTPGGTIVRTGWPFVAVALMAVLWAVVAHGDRSGDYRRALVVAALAFVAGVIVVVVRFRAVAKRGFDAPAEGAKDEQPAAVTPGRRAQKQTAGEIFMRSASDGGGTRGVRR
jgi:hypothetical protein